MRLSAPSGASDPNLAHSASLRSCASPLRPFARLPDAARCKADGLRGLVIAQSLSERLGTIVADAVDGKEDGFQALVRLQNLSEGLCAGTVDSCLIQIKGPPSSGSSSETPPRRHRLCRSGCTGDSCLQALVPSSKPWPRPRHQPGRCCCARGSRSPSSALSSKPADREGPQPGASLDHLGQSPGARHLDSLLRRKFNLI